ncbi:increased DNA methylation 2-like isoform X1 [Primulina eburnea]|uniref:increased DNA methylation 2-like isoform X1 n=1 Tax=Primulina eburnea TaxID=1245227 RepID=UPI003C6CB482
MENVFEEPLTDNQYFLLSLIMGAYFGPHLKQESFCKSALQRYAEGLSPYNANDLAGSHMKIEVMEKVYYYILRMAERSVVVPEQRLRLFIHGNNRILVDGPETYPSFGYLFPPEYHKLSQSKNHHDNTIANVVFINNPELYFIKQADLERFKRLTGFHDFSVDIDHATFHESNVKLQMIVNLDVRSMNCVPYAGLNHDVIEPSNCIMPFTSSEPNDCPVSYGSMVPSPASSSSVEDFDPGMIFVPSREEWNKIVSTSKCGFALTGSAARGHIGPVLGLTDIGESGDSYFFSVSLPGVRRDERDFSCEVESDGKVVIKGVTVTGERTILKHGQEFKMRSQNLCPPGHFSISFNLPGPVDPRQFHGTFSTDGIFQGIAMKPTGNLN